ncbi:MAG TPA: hypothetical protein VEW74_05900, partial [Candidatus Nitrosotalea sp.]|nr:hypothetical protein [Candidatus Nitrosotalea sp.]
KPFISTNVRGVIDFGGGTGGSTGLNNFLGVRKSGLYITRRFESVTALDDTWHPNQQHTNGSGQYVRTITFKPGATGSNVTIRTDALGSTVTVGPAPVPTPTPSTSPSSSPTPTPTPTP